MSKKSSFFAIYHFQEGSNSLELNGSNYALFGPYPDQCITAPSTCTTGFTFGLWIKKSSDCRSSDAKLATTRVRRPRRTEGMWINCRPNVNQVKYGVSINPNYSSTAFVAIANGADVWFYATMVWQVGQPIVINENGQHVANGSWNTGPGFAAEVNTARNLAFGLENTDGTNPSKYAKGCKIDGVRMFNRHLKAAEVLALYRSYGNTVTTTGFIITAGPPSVSNIDIVSNMTELNMETVNYNGNAPLSMAFKKV